MNVDYAAPTSAPGGLMRLFLKFVGAERGNVAIMFALAVFPLMAAVGIAIDYARAVDSRAAMQSATDATALMLLKDGVSSLTAAELATKATNYFNGLACVPSSCLRWLDPKSPNISVSATYTASSQSLVVTASASVPTVFTLAGFLPSMPIKTSSTAVVGAPKLRVALVLDNTGSMTDYNKIGALQTAATNLVNQLSALAQNSGDVYVSVVPFAVDVNVGTANVAASWLRWDRWDPSIGSNPPTTWCSDSGWSDTLAQCQDRGYTWNHTPNTSNHALWNGCVTDRDQSYDVNATAPTVSSISTLFTVDQDGDCPAAAILPLTYDWTAVKNEINAMSPSGGTNQAIALHWGWLSLLQQAPLNAPAEAAGAQYQHIIILFTDGLNTADRWYGDYQNPTPQLDARMKLLCDNIKATGVTIYTIQINTGGDAQSTVLPYCASTSSDFFMLTQSGQINTAFQQIGSQISKLRLSK